jgi:hypothetical protein
MQKREILTTILTVLTSVFLVASIVLAITTIGTDISTDGSLSVSGATTLGGNTSIGGTSDVSGDTTLNSTLLVYGYTSLVSDTVIYAPLEVYDATTLNSTLAVTGSVTLGTSADFSLLKIQTGSITVESGDILDLAWVNPGGRLYTRDGIRTDGDIIIDSSTANLTIPAGALSDGSVLSADIADGTIVAVDIATNAIQWTIDIPILVDGAVTTVAADAIGTPTFAHTTIQLDAETIAHLKSAKLIIDYTWAATADGTIQFYDSTAGVVRGEPAAAFVGGESSEWAEISVDPNLVAGNTHVVRADIITAGAAGETVSLYRAILRLTLGVN